MLNRAGYPTPLPIAVIGLACRLPGAADAAAFWQLLEAGQTAITRLDRDALLRAGVSASAINDETYVPVMAPLPNADAFDAEFFGMSPHEAILTDPHHRLFLQAAWHALEDAGIDPHGTDARIGCYAGAGMSLYAGRRMASYASVNLLSDLAFVDSIVAPQITVGNKHDYLATKVSYKFGFKGPAVNLHTACSTGLVAVHLACVALQTNECDVAMAGAVAVPAPAVCGYRFDGGLLSPDGICLPFDRRANGTVGGAGVAIVILKRLDHAIADGNRVRAVILGSAINNDGAEKVSFLSPSVEGQIGVIRAALNRSGVARDTIGHIETHGTGTPHGDPIEFLALTEAYGAAGAAGAWRCALGAAKANIGHLDTAAGAAGLVKAILALERGIVPPIAGFEHPNEELELDGNALYVPRAAEAWPVQGSHPRRAAVSSFGAGGTNAHMIIESFGAGSHAAATAVDDRPAALLLSAKSADALARLAREASQSLAASRESWLNVAATSQRRRRHFPKRLAIVAGNSTLAAAACAMAADAGADPTRSLSQRSLVGRPFVFLFGGQGGLDLATIRSFRTAFSGFAKTFDDVADRLLSFGGPDLRAVIIGDAPIGAAAVAQPLQFAFVVSLATQWILAGVKPALVIGHSLGEFAAAFISGVLSMDAALRLVAARGRFMDQHCPPGGMVAVAAARETCERLIADTGLGRILSVSVVNAPEAVVLSGTQQACDQFADIAKRMSLSCHRLETTHGFHSSSIDPMLPAFENAVFDETFGTARVPFLATAEGGGSYEDPSYWIDQLRQPVDFKAAADILLAEQPWVSIEIGFDATLTNLVERSAPHGMGVDGVASALYRGARGAAAFLQAAGDLHCCGIAIDWTAIGPDTDATAMAALPAYPFETRNYRHERRDTNVTRPSTHDRPPSVIVRMAAMAKPLRGKGGGVAHRDVILAVHGTTASNVAFPSAPVVEMDELVGARASIGLGRLAGLVQALDKPLLLVDVTGSSSSCDTDDWFHYGAVQSLFAAMQAGELVLEICIVTHGGVAADEVDPIALNPEQAAIWALARTARCEIPDVIIRCVDIDALDAKLLSHAVPADARNEDEILIRQGRRFAPGWRREPLPHVTYACRGDATYLIVGGMSGVGLAAAEHLAERGARSLLLVGRGKTVDPDLEDRIAALIQKGVKVARLRLDVAERPALEALSRLVATSAMPVGGIIHAAGTLANRLIMNQTPALLREASAAKFSGFSTLIKLAQGLRAPPDFIVAFSSVAGAFGSPGQSNYAAANAALAAVALAGRRNGLPTTVVHWGAIEATGMTARIKDVLALTRIAPIPCRSAMNELEAVLADPWSSAPVVAGDGPWPPVGAWLDNVTLAASLWMAHRPSAPSDRAAKGDRPDGAAIRRIVQDKVAGITGESADQVALDIPFAEVGIDSLGGMQLRHALNERLALRLSPTLIFQYPTVELVSRHIERRLAEQNSSGGAPVDEPRVVDATIALARELEMLSDRKILKTP